MDLKDFQNTTSMSIEDFKSFIEPTLGLSPNSVNSIAATSTLAADGGVEEHREARQALSNQPSRQGWVQQWIADSRGIFSDARSEVDNIVVSPLLDNEQKGEFISAAANLENRLPISHLEMLAYRALSQDGGEFENEAQFVTREDTIDLVTSIVEQKKQLQAAYNEETLRRETTLGQKVGDFAEVIVPFVEQVFYANLARELDLDVTWTMGNQKRLILDHFNNLPVNEKEVAIGSLLDYLKDNDQLIFRDGNDLLSIDILERIMTEKDYSNTHRYFDNFITVLDATGVLGPVAKTLQIPVKGTMVAAGSAAKSIVKGTPNPVSPHSIISEANPTAARTNIVAAEADETGVVADTLMDASRADAIADTYLPDPEIGDRIIRVKVDPNGPTQFVEDETISFARTYQPTYEFTNREYIEAEGRIKENLSSVIGFRVNPAEMTIGYNSDGSTRFHVLAHPLDRGWKSADAAMDNTLLAFREFGIVEEDVQLYMRTAEGWVQTDRATLAGRKAARDEFFRQHIRIPDELKEIDYAVGIRYDWRMNLQDMNEHVYENFTVRGGFLKAFSQRGQKEGSVAEHIVPIDSMFHEAITLPLNAATDREVRILKTYIDSFKPFTVFYNKAGKLTQARLRDYIVEANQKGVPFNQTDLAARGFSIVERQALRVWRNANDNLWRATNQDMAVSARNRGYMMLQDNSGTNLVLRPLKEGGVSPKITVREVGGESTNLTREELSELYASGGTIAKLSQPQKIDGEWVEHFIVRNTTEGGYLRAIRNGDILLPYREGYYPIMYDANFFIDKVVRTPDGMRSVTIASAKSKGDADAYYARLIEENVDGVDDPSSYYVVRPDRRNPQDGVFESSDNPWNRLVSSGSSAQMYRGKPLVDAAQPNTLRIGTNLIDPLEAVSTQISQVSRRIAIRPWLETTKSRWIDNYGQYLDLPTGNTGMTGFPANLNDIKGMPGVPSRTVNDARQMWMYIHHQESGYINSVDNGVKALMHLAADAAIDAGLVKIEEALRTGAKGSITSELKGFTFKAQLASAPIRQQLVQGHQVVQLISLHPSYVTPGIGKTGLANDWYEIQRVRYGVSDDPKYVAMLGELERSGMLEAVDSNNLVRKDQINLAELSAVSRARKVGGYIPNKLQEIGFDKGEQFVLMTSWLTHYDMAVKAKGAGNLTRRDLEELAGRARAFTLAMNRAGDLPYNQNSLNLFFRYLQVPHKSFAQALSSRSLTPAQKSRLLVSNGLLYGVPVGIFGNLLPNHWFEGPANTITGTDGTGDSPLTKKILEDGLTDVAYNALLTELSHTFGGGGVDIDWSAVAPTDLSGVRDLLTNIVTGDFKEAVIGSASFGLFMGDNPRLADGIWLATRKFTPFTDYHDPELDIRYRDVVNGGLQAFSGYSHVFRGIYALETRQKISSYGSILDSDLSFIEAIAQFAGLQTHTEGALFDAKEALYGEEEFRKTIPKDMERWYTQAKRDFARRGETVAGDLEMMERVQAEAWLVFDQHPAIARKALHRLIQKDAARGNMDFVQGMIDAMGIMDYSQLMEIASHLPDGIEKDHFLENITTMHGGN